MRETREGRQASPGVGQDEEGQVGGGGETWPQSLACRHAAASGRGEEDDGGLQWWAGPASAAGRTGRRQVSTLSLSLFPLFYFLQFVFDLI